MKNSSDTIYFNCVKIFFLFYISISLLIQIYHFHSFTPWYGAVAYYYYFAFMVMALIFSIYSIQFEAFKDLSEYKKLWIPIAIILYSFLIRIKANNIKPLWGDELYQFFEAKNINCVQAASEQHQTPIDYMFSFANFKLFGTTPFAIRLSAMLFSSLVLGNFYFIFKRVLKEIWSPLLLLVIMSLDYNFNYSSVEARPPALALFTISLVIFNLQNYFMDQSKKNTYSLLSSTIFYILSTGIQPLSLISSMTIIAFYLSVFTTENQTKKFRVLYRIFGITILLYSPLFLYLFKIAPARLPTNLSGTEYVFFSNLLKGFTQDYIFPFPLALIIIPIACLLLCLNFLMKRNQDELLRYLLYSWIFFQIFYVSLFLTFVQWHLMFWYMLSSTAIIWVIFAISLSALKPRIIRILILLIGLYFFIPKSSLMDTIADVKAWRNDLASIITKITSEEINKPYLITYVCLEYNFCTEARSYPDLDIYHYKNSLVRLSIFSSVEENYKSFKKLASNITVYLSIGDCKYNCYKKNDVLFTNENFFLKTQGVYTYKFSESDPLKLLKIANIIEVFINKKTFNFQIQDPQPFETQILIYAFLHKKNKVDQKFKEYEDYFGSKLDTNNKNRLQENINYFLVQNSI